MASTLQLSSSWDLTLDADSNMAVIDESSEPISSLAQDAASAIMLFLGDYYWDTTTGVPWLQQILGKNPPISLVKQQLVDAAMTVPDVAAAQVFFTSFSDRAISGQVQVLDSTTGDTTSANFAVSPFLNPPQG
jgi:hypothetical protein